MFHPWFVLFCFSLQSRTHTGINWRLDDKWWVFFSRTFLLRSFLKFTSWRFIFFFFSRFGVSGGDETTSNPFVNKSKSSSMKAPQSFEFSKKAGRLRHKWELRETRDWNKNERRQLLIAADEKIKKFHLKSKLRANIIFSLIFLSEWNYYDQRFRKFSFQAMLNMQFASHKFLVVLRRFHHNSIKCQILIHHGYFKKKIWIRKNDWIWFSTVLAQDLVNYKVALVFLSCTYQRHISIKHLDINLSSTWAEDCKRYGTNSIMW